LWLKKASRNERCLFCVDLGELDKFIELWVVDADFILLERTVLREDRGEVDARGADVDPEVDD
jgi:hypothetical protein